mgnify:CR=1 FL=1|tara:strand:+ start:1212 stop:1508 length:297 start_codon:yes stop_codon:yes gene_type:complete
MIYKLDKKWFEKNEEGVVILKKTKIDFNFKGSDVKSIVAGNQSLLEELYEMGKPYVKSNSPKPVVKKSNKQLNKVKIDESKETTGKQKGQVLPEAKEE